ncbi:hypothetical protein [Paraburkholderia xenovorans]|nr:hypothetical protein [Paraburkholderia xenovorans]
MIQRDADEHVTHASTEISTTRATPRRFVVCAEQTAQRPKLK